MEKVWDLSTNHYVRDGMESYEFKQHKEDNVTVNPNENAKYEFTIKDVNDYIIYSHGYINPEFQITKADGTAIGTENVTLVNTGNLFKKAELHVGKSLVDEIDLPCLAHHVNGLINFTNDYSKSEATNMFYFIDTSESANKIPLIYDSNAAPDLTTSAKANEFIALVKQNVNYNEGFTKRWILTKNSNKIQLWIPLKQYFGFFNDFRKIISGIDVKINLSRSDNNDMLFTDVANANFKVKITDISLWLPHVKLYPEQEIIYNDMFTKDIEINWDSNRVIPSNELNGSSGTYIVNSTSDMLDYIYVIPQYYDKRENQNENNMIFENLEMIRSWIRINNQKYPAEDVDVSFKEDEQSYGRYYSELLAAGFNHNNTETGCLVSYENYKRLYPIIVFDVSKHPKYNNVSNLKVEFYWKLKAAPQKSYRFYFVLVEKRNGIMNMQNKRFDILRTLK